MGLDGTGPKCISCRPKVSYRLLPFSLQHLLFIAVLHQAKNDLTNGGRERYALAANT